MQKSISLLSVVLIVLCVQQASGLFFHLKEGKNKCFLEDLPEHTLVVVEVEASDLPDGSVVTGTENGEFTRRKNADTEPLAIVGVITYGSETVVEQTIPAKGRFAFTSQEAGEYSICLKTASSRWFGAGAVKIDVDLQVGESGTNDYDEIKALEQLTDLEVFVRKLNDKVVDIRKEQAYYKYREQTLRDTSELANSNAMWFSILQTAILLGSGIWQIMHLKSFFKAKKMV